MRAFLIIPLLLMFVYSPMLSADSFSWDSLSNAEKKSLKNYKSKWNSFSKAEKRSLKKWSKIPPAKWKRMKLKYRQWKSLTPAQRRSLEKKIKRYKASTTKEKRVRLRKWQEWVNSLPPTVRTKFKQAWRVMSKKERRAYYHKLKKKYP